MLWLVILQVQLSPEMKQVQLNTLKPGEYFRRNPTSPVWVKDRYFASDKTFTCYKFENVNHLQFLKPETKVWVGFTFDSCAVRIMENT